MIFSTLLSGLWVFYGGFTVSASPLSRLHVQLILPASDLKPKRLTVGALKQLNRLRPQDDHTGNQNTQDHCDQNERFPATTAKMLLPRAFRDTTKIFPPMYAELRRFGAKMRHHVTQLTITMNRVLRGLGRTEDA